MPYDPRNPASLFEGDNLLGFMSGLNNAYALKHNLPSGDLGRDDVGVCMSALSDAERELEAHRG